MRQVFHARACRLVQGGWTIADFAAGRLGDDAAKEWTHAWGNSFANYPCEKNPFFRISIYMSVTKKGGPEVMVMVQHVDAKQGAKLRRRATPEQVWVALAHCYRTMSSLIEDSFVDAGLSLTDFMLLEALLHKGPMTITAIQEAVLLASGSMTAAVDRLEVRGLIVRTLQKQDRRARVLELTTEGVAAIKDAYEMHSGQLRQWMTVLSADERAVTFASLRKLEKQLKGVRLNAPS